MAVSLQLPGWIEPYARLFRGQQPGAQLAIITRQLGLPVLGLAVFLLLWQALAPQVQTTLGHLPGPAQVWSQAKGLHQEYRDDKDRELAFYQRQEERIARMLEKSPGAAVPPLRAYTGNPTFYTQIATSLKTVMSGFVVAAVVAIPLGIAIGLSGALYNAVNPLIQVFKPVSPLAWLPLVTLVVASVYDTPDPMVPKSFVTSLITVALCCIWPTVINTAVGVASVSPDLNNVSKVLRLNWFAHVRRIVLPAAVPMIFTGLRLSLGVAWMVLIAAEMLSQNPGLGKFIWDEFQNGNAQSLGRIVVAVITIGLIGYLLDQIMLLLQRLLSWDKKSVTR
ncbi:MAG: ABC transporter permease [Porticoccaceae bacterium]|jgi:nitrate/nitrite transport system permease protein